MNLFSGAGLTQSWLAAVAATQQECRGAAGVAHDDARQYEALAQSRYMAPVDLADSLAARLPMALPGDA